MELIEEAAGGVTVIAPRGRLDSASSPILGARMDELAATPDGRLVLDLAEVDFVSSAGLRVILSAAKRARAAGGRLALCAIQPAVLEILEISGFNTLLSIQPARAVALETVTA